MTGNFRKILTVLAKNTKASVSEYSIALKDKEYFKSTVYRLLPKSVAAAYVAFGLSDMLISDPYLIHGSGQAYADECGLIKMPGDDCMLPDDRSWDVDMLSTDKQEYRGYDTVFISGSLEPDREYFVGVLSPEDDLVGWVEVATDADGLYRDVPVFDFYPELDSAGRYVVGMCLDEECIDNVSREIRYDP